MRQWWRRPPLLLGRRTAFFKKKFVHIDRSPGKSYGAPNTQLIFKADPLLKPEWRKGRMRHKNGLCENKRTGLEEGENPLISNLALLHCP